MNLFFWRRKQPTIDVIGVQETDPELLAASQKADWWEEFSEAWGRGEDSQDLNYEQMKAKFQREWALHGMNMVY